MRLKQHSDLGQAINELVAKTRKRQEYNLKRRTEAEPLSDEEELYILNYNLNDLQKQLQEERVRAGKLYQQMQDERDKVTEQLEISQEQVKTLQNQLQDQLNW